MASAQGSAARKQPGQQGQGRRAPQQGRKGDAPVTLVEADESARMDAPSWELFDRQEARYRDEVLPSSVKARVAVEAGSVLGWDRYVGPQGATIGMRGFGASAPVNAVMKEFGFTAENVSQTAKAQIAFWRHHGEESTA